MINSYFVFAVLRRRTILNWCRCMVRVNNFSYEQLQSTQNKNHRHFWHHHHHRSSCEKSNLMCFRSLCVFVWFCMYARCSIVMLASVAFCLMWFIPFWCVCAVRVCIVCVGRHKIHTPHTKWTNVPQTYIRSHWFTRYFCILLAKIYWIAVYAILRRSVVWPKEFEQRKSG